MKRSTLILLIILLLVAALTVGTVLLVRQLSRTDLTRVGNAEALARLLKTEGGSIAFGAYEASPSSYYAKRLASLRYDLVPADAAKGTTYLRGGVLLHTTKRANGSERATMMYGINDPTYLFTFDGDDNRTAKLTNDGIKSIPARLRSILGSDAPLTLLSALSTALTEADFGGLSADRLERTEDGYRLSTRRTDSLTPSIGKAVAAYLTGDAAVEEAKLTSFSNNLQSDLTFHVTAKRLEAITLTVNAPAHTTSLLPIPADTRFEASIRFSLGDAYEMKADLFVKNGSQTVEECTLLLSSVTDGDTEGTLPFSLSVSYAADKVADSGTRARRLSTLELSCDPQTSALSYQGQQSYSDYRNKNGEHISEAEALLGNTNAFRLHSEQILVKRDENGRLVLKDGEESFVLQTANTLQTPPYPFGAQAAVMAADTLYQKAVAVNKSDAPDLRDSLYTTVLYVPKTPNVKVEIVRSFFGQVTYLVHFDDYTPTSGYVKVTDGEDGFVITTEHGTAYREAAALAEKTPKAHYNKTLYFRQSNGKYLSYRLSAEGVLTEYAEQSSLPSGKTVVSRDKDGNLSFEG